MSARIHIVTGTDTEVGKTVVTAALAAQRLGRGRSVVVIKPAQTGIAPDEPGDLDEVRRLVGPVDTVEGVRLPDPLAPDTAAARIGARLPTLTDQRDLVLAAAAGHDDVLVEGSGGVTVNLGIEFTLLELGAALRDAGADPVWVVVARAGLGTLNHTRLTVDAVRARGFAVAGVVVGAWPDEPGLAERHNVEDLPRTSGVPLLGSIPAGAGRLDPDVFGPRAAGWIADY